MVDNPALRGAQDRSRISLHEEHEERYWTEKFGVTRDALAKAVDAVGHSVEKVTEYFSSGTRPQQGGEAGTTRFGMEDGDNGDVPATGTDPERQSGGGR